MKKPHKSEIREKNSQIILDAAEHEFSVHGYRGTSVQMIADRSGLPKANLHYYYKNKSALYGAVLERILVLWNTGLDDLRAEDDPREVLEKFIRIKVHLSCTRPMGSKLFATEIISGAPYLSDYIRSDMRNFIEDKVKIIEEWIQQKKILPIDPLNLIFMIWASTQHYADFNTQVLILMNKEKYEDKDIKLIADNLVQIILRGCGLTTEK